MAIPHLPLEILIEIFSRFPAKSIGKCRCLSQSWRNRLSAPRFVKFHLHHRTHEENLIFISPSHSLHLITPPVKDDAVSTKVVELRNTWTSVVGSCNGLILLLNEEDEMFLVNPITLHQVKIPDSPLALKKNESFSMRGFGYESSSDDYKIVMLYYYDTDNEHEPDCADTFVHVYSLRMGLWKKFDVSPYDHAIPEICSGAFVNGAIHWLASRREPGYQSVIASFDLAKEVFVEIPPPNNVDVGKFVFNKLLVLDGCLCMVDDIQSNTIIDLWIMKEYGVRESWTRFSMYSGNWTVDGFKPLCFIGNEEVVLLSEGESLVVYNLKDGTTKNMVVDGVPTPFLDGGTFVDSLISPDDLLGVPFS